MEHFWKVRDVSGINYPDWFKHQQEFSCWTYCNANSSSMNRCPSHNEWSFKHVHKKKIVVGMQILMFCLMVPSSVPMIINSLFQHASGSSPCETLHCSPSAESADLQKNLLFSLCWKASVVKAQNPCHLKQDHQHSIYFWHFRHYLLLMFCTRTCRCFTQWCFCHF